MHYWGDDWFKQYGNELYEAISEINKGMREIHVLCLGKEKYGCLRTDFFCLWCGSWLDWKYIYNHYIDPSKHDFKTTIKRIQYWVSEILAWFNQKFGVVRLVNKWQTNKINQLFQEVCKKHPDIVDELISDTDCYMYIKPGKYGDIDGEAIHRKYWKTYINGEIQND